MVRADFIRPAAVAGAFYPDDRVVLKKMVNRQLDYGRELLAKLEDDDNGGDPLPQGAPKAVIVPHAGYVYSGTTAALAYALLERGRGTIRRAVIVGPTHRVAVRGVACSSATAFATPLGAVPVDVASERRALGLLTDDDGDADGTDEPDDVGGALCSGMRALPDAPAQALIVNDPTHAQEHAVEVQIPFLQTVLDSDLEIVPLNAGDASPREVGDVLRALWGGPETVIVISSDLSHYHPEEYARELDDETIDAIAHLHGPIHPRRACGAYPVNGLLDVLTRGLRPATSAASSIRGHADEGDVAFDLRLLGRSTSGDDGVVALAGEPRPEMRDPYEAVVGYSSFAVWQQDASADRGIVLLELARAAIREHLGLDDDPAGRPDAIIARHPWLDEPGASFVTLTEHGDLRGCIGTLEAYRPLGRDVADHAVDAASRDPRFTPVTPREYPLLDVEVSVLSRPEPIAVRSRAELESTLNPGEDGLILTDGRGRRATFLPQVWEQLPDPHDFVSHLLAKAGISPHLDWDHGEIECERYGVTAYAERE
ncbi:AmmeMemoRadiSam system protein B [Bifidobacterium rousetti]|uniref:AmmeMemoRadiSam system protein B n=1 Tax=Bifidobacterium rousetti TaxID=2045439 RepID=UPI001CC2A91B|nr:AmmeMemoRadiSam system protein B [Bifidobacterium rousetti]